MQVTRYIERHGFRRWYERQLIESHAYLALGFVALILLLSGLELLSSAEAGIRFAMEVHPGRMFAYELTRPGDRKFRVEFDLSKAVPTPPAPWGAGPLAR